MIKEVIMAVTGIGVGFLGGNVLHSFLNKNQTSKMSFDNFIERASKKIDAHMIASEKKDSLTFIGGNCRIYISPDESSIVNVECDIYGENADGSFRKTEYSFKVPVCHFANDSHTIEKLNQLKFAPFTFKIAPPR